MDRLWKRHCDGRMGIAQRDSPYFSLPGPKNKDPTTSEMSKEDVVRIVMELFGKEYTKLIKTNILHIFLKAQVAWKQNVDLNSTTNRTYPLPC